MKRSLRGVQGSAKREMKISWRHMMNNRSMAG